MRIQHNISALNTHRNLAFNNAQASKNLEKLSSGYKINRAGDDAAGLAISEKMRGQIRGLDMASKNSQDGISLIQTAEGALNETHAILQRMRELAVQAGNDTNTTDDRGQIQKEIDQLTSEINRIGNTTEFNTKKLVNGELGAATTSKEVAVGGDYKVGASAVSGDNVAAIKGDKVELKITGKASGDLDWSALDATKTNTLTITKETDGSVKVNVAAEAGAKTLTIADKAMEFDGTNYTFNQDGISFTFSKDQVDKMDAGKDIKVDLNQGATTGTNDITKNPIDLGAEVSALTASAPTTTKVSDVAVDANGLPEGTKSIEIEKKAANEFTITFKDKDGTALNTSDYKAAAGDTSFDFNQNGIAFKAEFAAAADTFSTTIDLKTEKQTVTDTTAKDTSIKFQIGANENQAMAVSISDMRASALGITGSGDGFQKSATVTNGTDAASVEKSLDLSTHASAASAITVIDNAISTVSTQRSQLGAVQNRLEHTINNLGASSENLTAAESRIRDTDMAKEMMGFTKNNILMQAAQSMLAQANQQPQGVLQLLG